MTNQQTHFNTKQTDRDDVFSQAHRSVFCTDKQNDCHWYQVFNLVPISENPDNLPIQQAPNVTVCVGLLSDDLTQKSHLQISYFIAKTPLFDLQIINDNRHQADFLWQENCLECFVEYGKADAYFESNVALDGRYSAYHFDRYRTPDALPPRQAKSCDLLINQTTPCDVLDGFYSRHVCLTSEQTALPTRLNPTVILYHNGMAIYYAPCHANPPDFHDKSYWQTIDYLLKS